MGESEESRYSPADHDRNDQIDQGRELNDPPRYVVDSSVVAKVFLLDEPLVDEARRLFEAFYDGRVILLVPPLAFLETANSIVKATRQRRITVEAGRLAMEQLFDLGLEVAASDDAVELAIRSAYPVAETLNRSIYDAIFLVLSRALGAPLITADGPLRTAASPDFPVVHLSEFDVP